MVVAAVAPRLAAALFLTVAAFQVALVLGAPWGVATQGGSVDGSLPMSGRVVAAASFVLLVGFALAILARAVLGPARRLPWRLVTLAAWITTVYSCVGILLNAASPSGVERSIWVPVGIVLAAACITTLVTTRR